MQTVSYIVTAKSLDDPKLKELLESIQLQEGVGKDICVVTRGTSESAKAIGISETRSDIICILASDNYLDDRFLSIKAIRAFEKDSKLTGAYPTYYSYYKGDNLLSRYFALIGANDILACYMGKCDRKPHRPITGSGYTIKDFRDRIPTLGDNGFFVRRSHIEQANLSSYYHIDVCEDMRKLGYHFYAELDSHIWHRTGECSIIDFFRRRARFGVQHAFNPDRRWHLVDIRDSLRLCWFIISATTLVHPIGVAIIGYLRTRDNAWMIHPLMCLGTLLTYGFVVIKLLANRMFQSLSALLEGRKN